MGGGTGVCTVVMGLLFTWISVTVFDALGSVSVSNINNYSSSDCMILFFITREKDIDFL